MAKKTQKVILENVELQPQVIGLTYKKKSNIGRVVFIFIALGLAIYYINDISIFINNLLGRKTADTIQNAGSDSEEPDKIGTENPSGNETEDVKYYDYSNALAITEGNLTLNNFNIVNTSSNSVNMAGNKYFIELFDENKTLLNRFKTDIGTISANANISFSFNLTNPNIRYVAFSQKTIQDYPPLELQKDSTGNATLTCKKENETIIYTFLNDELKKISHTISDNNITDVEYENRLNSYQNKVNNYNSLNGISALLNNNVSGYTVVFNIDLTTANVNNLDEKYYYSHLTKANIVNFEMETYGFTCN